MNFFSSAYKSYVGLNQVVFFLTGGSLDGYRLIRWEFLKIESNFFFFYGHAIWFKVSV